VTVGFTDILFNGDLDMKKARILRELNVGCREAGRPG